MKSMIGTVGAVALGLMVLSVSAPDAGAQAAAPSTPPAKKAKNVKDTGEYDIYNDVIKDSQANPMNGKKFVADLDTWTQKYPDTEFKDIRTMYYVQAYAAAGDAGKSVEAAKPLLAEGVDGMKDGLDVAGNGQSDPLVLNALYLTARSGAALAATGNASSDQLATASKAATMLSDFAKGYFVKEKKPSTASDADWAQGLKMVDDQAKGTLFQIALMPGNSAVKGTKDATTCAAAEGEYRKAAEQYPQSGVLANLIAQMSLCQQATSPAKTQQALYMYARAVVLPTGGIGGLDADSQKKLDDYLKKIYTTIHGSDEGLAGLKQMAANSPLPPADFKVKTATEIAAEKAQEFQSKNPQLAMWMNVKGQLADTNGQAYFENNLKGTNMAGENGAKLLKGTVVEAKPACRPKELLVAVPLPDQQGSPNAEITIKIVDDQMKASALTGKPEPGAEVQFNGAPSAFTKDPFMLTLDSQKADVDVTLSPCTAAAPARKGAPPATKKKQ